MSILDTIAQVESGNRNIPNTTAGTSSGQAQGFFQITTGTWNQFAPVAGVDLGQFPTPLSAPRDIQAQVASSIPLSRWAPSTVQAVTSQFGSVDTSLPVGVLGAGGGQSTLDPGVGPFEPNTGFTGGLTTGPTTQPQFQILGPDGQPIGAQIGNDPTGLAPGQTIGPQLGAGGSGTASTLGAGQPGYLPPAPTGGPAATGITPGLAAGISGWIGGIEGAVGTAFKNAFAGLFGGIQNWFARGFLILLAIVLIGLALFAMLMKTEFGKTMQSAVKQAAVAA